MNAAHHWITTTEQNKNGNHGRATPFITPPHNTPHSRTPPSKAFYLQGHELFELRVQIIRRDQQVRVEVKRRRQPTRLELRLRTAVHDDVLPVTPERPHRRAFRHPLRARRAPVAINPGICRGAQELPLALSAAAGAHVVSDGFLVGFLVQLSVGVLVQDVRDYLFRGHWDARRHLERAENQFHLVLSSGSVGVIATQRTTSGVRRLRQTVRVCISRDLRPPSGQGGRYNTVRARGLST